MDIPLPGEPDPHLANFTTEVLSVQISSPHNIPLPSPRSVQSPQTKSEEIKSLCSSPPPPPPPPLPPSTTDAEDSNRYSPSRVTGDDDTSKDDQQEQETSHHHGSPLVHSSLAAKGTRTTVLGKAQAKKRLLAFSMTKQGGGQGLSFGFNKKVPNKMSTGSMPFAGTSTEDDTGENKERDERVTSPKKKGMGKKGISRDDKARAVVSAIEEIKREEMLMRGVLGYGTQINVLGEQAYPLPLMSTSIIPPAKPRDDLEMSNILSEQQKGAIEELLGSLLTHDSEKKNRDEEKEKKRSDEKRKRDSEKSSRHSKERHRSKERHSRSGRDHEKEEKKKHRPSELPKNWQQFKERSFKYEEIRRLKLKLEKDKLASNNRDRMRKSRDREHRSRSHEKRHKSPNQSEEKDRTTESDHDIMSKPFESTSRLIYPFMAVGVRQMQKEYPRSLIRFTKSLPPIPYCENPATSKAFYRTREEILCEASARVVEIMLHVVNGDLCKTHMKAEKNYKIKQTTDTNLSNSLAALQVSYDENEIDENISSSDDTSGIVKERPWFLPDNLWADSEEVGITTSSDVELNVKRERSDETEIENYKKRKDSSVDSSEVKETELPNYLNNEHEREMKSSESGETKHPLRTSERTTVRSKWDSDYEEDRMQEDGTTHGSLVENSQPLNEVSEKWEEKEIETNFIENNSKDEIQTENRDKSGSESENSSDDNSSSSANESNTEDSIPGKDSHEMKDKKVEYEQNRKTVKDIDNENVHKPTKCASTGSQESSVNGVQPENNSDGNTNLKLASEYEEFMKAVSFESSVMDDGESEVVPSGPDKSSLKQTEAVTSPIPEQMGERNSSEAGDSEASHDKLDIEPAEIEGTPNLKKVSEPKLQIKPKLMTSSASEDELLPPEEEKKQESKVVKSLENAVQNNTQSKRDKKHRSSSSDSSSSSVSSYESEELKEKRKSKSKKKLKKKRKKVVHSKKKVKKGSKKKRVASSSSSESDSSSNADSSSSSSSDDNKKKQKHKEKSRRRTKSSSSEGSDNDSSSGNASSDDHVVRKKKKKKKVKKTPKKKSSKKRKRSRKESESSDSEEIVRSRRSKTRHRNSKKDSAKENNAEHFSNDEKTTPFVDSNTSSHRKDSETRTDPKKKQSAKSKGGSNEVESSQKKSSRKYNKDNSSIDESYEEERDKKGLSRKKASVSYKKSSNYHESETSEDECERKTIKKRRRERRSCTTSPVVNSNKKRRRSPSTSPEHSPTPQRRNSTEGKSVSQHERSKEQSNSSRKLKHSSGSSKKGHKHKDLEVSEDADVFSEEDSFKRNDERRRYRSSYVMERNDWEVNSANEGSYNSNSNSGEESNSDEVEDLFSSSSPRRKSSLEDCPDQLLRSEDIKKEIFSDEEEEEENELPFIGIETGEKKVENARNISRKQVESCESDNDNNNDGEIESENKHLYRKQTHSSCSEVSGISNLKSFSNKYSSVQVKVEPQDYLLSDSEKDVQDSRSLQLYSPDRPHEESESHLTSQPVTNREICSTESSQFSQLPEKVMDRFGSDISQESFKDSCEGSFSGKLFRKQNFTNRSDENDRSSCLNPETPQILPSRGINLPLDNIPLPPLTVNQDETRRVSELEEISNSTRCVKINNSLTEKLLNLPPPEFCNLSANSVKPGSQRHVISFKLLSPSCRIQSSQALVDSSDNVEDGENSSFSKQQPLQDIRNLNEDIFETEKKTKSGPDRKSGISIIENSRGEWLPDHDIAEPLVPLNISTNITDSEVSSSSKVQVDSEPISSKTDTLLPKERSRKRPSRWGMTTIPPKRVTVDQLYESLPEAKIDTSVFSPTVELKKLYDRHTSSNVERKENEIEKEVHGISLVDSVVKKTMESLNKKLPIISDKKIELENNTEKEKFNAWERESVDDQSESWEVSRGKDSSFRNKYTVDQWHDKPVNRNKFSEKVEKGPEGCGPLIDWENDFEQSKSMNDVLPTTEVNLFHYSQETELSVKSNPVQSCLVKENISQDDSESEWETREVNYQIKSPTLRLSNSKEKTVPEKQEPFSEITSQSHLDFQVDERSWGDNIWHNQKILVSKREDRRHREEIHESKKDNEIRGDVHDKRTSEEERRDNVFRDTRKNDENDAVVTNKERARLNESQTQHDPDDYRFRENFADDRGEESVSKEQVIKTSNYIKHCEDGKLGYVLNEKEHSRIKKSDKYWKNEKDDILRERQDLVNQDSMDKSRKEYDERVKRELDEKDRSTGRIKKHSGERERDRRETDDERREDRTCKEYSEGERSGIRDKERRENEIQDELVRKDYVERERSSTRDRERRETRDRRDERRRDRDRDRRGDRRDRERWEREKRDRHRDERDSGQRSRSPSEYHDRDRRESHREERDRSRSPPVNYWQGEWERGNERGMKDRNCDRTGNYFIRDIPLPIKSTLGGSGLWPSGATGETEMELSCSPASSPLVGFKRSLADSTISDSELVACKQEDMARHSREMSPSSSAYSSGFTSSKHYERKQMYLKRPVIATSPSSDRPPTPTNSPAFSPKRLSLDDRIEMELGVKNTPPSSAVSQYQVYQHPQPPLQQQPQPLQQELSLSQSQQQSSLSFAQYYTHVPPPTQFEPQSNKFLSMPPPPYGQPIEEYVPPQHMYPPPPVKPLMTRMPPPSIETSTPKRRPPLLPTPNIRPMTNWDSPEAFIGAQPSQSSRVVQVGNVLQVVPVEVPPPSTPTQTTSQSIVLQTGNVLQVIPSDTLPNSLPPVSCGELPPVSNANSQVVQVGNVLQVIPGPATSTRSGTLSVVAPPKSTFPPTTTHTTAQGAVSHMQPLHLPPMHGPPPSQAPALLLSPTHMPPSHLPPTTHLPPTHLPPPHGVPTHPPPLHCPPPHTPPMRGPPVHTPPIQVSSIHGLTSHVPSPSQAITLLKSPNLEMSPSPVITSPLLTAHSSLPSPATPIQVTTAVATSPIPTIPTSGTNVISNVSLVTSVIPSNIAPTPVAAPISYSPPASPFLVPPVVHTPMVPVGLPESTPVVSQGDCPIPFLSSVEMAQASQMEEAERRRAERARRRAEKEKRRKEKEKRHQNKIQQATEMIIKKALEQEGDMLGTASDIDLEEMRLIEEAMQQVPEQEEEEETPQTDVDHHLRKKRRKPPVETQPLPPAGKGILVSPGFREKPSGVDGIERKSVKFADGIRPGEGTSPSAGEDLPSPPPPPRKLPKEKRYKKKKKKKIKVKIIRQINVEDEDDDDEDVSPPPPPPGSPPPPPMYPPGAHYPPTYPSGFTYSTAPPFTVLPGVDSSTGAATGTSGNLFTPLYHQHHHTTTTTHTTTVQFAPPPPPVTPVPPPTQNPHLFKRETKSNP